MASPQLENGYTKIANEILDALIKWRLSPYESSILLVVLRKTYGFNKKEDWISLSQFVKATGIKKPHVCRALRMLIKQKMITKGGTPKKPLYKFQKNFDIWAQLPKGARSHHVTKGGNATLPKGVIQSLPKGAHTKETTITKETITLATDVASRKTKSPKKKPMEEVTYEPLHKPSRKKPSGARRNEPKELVLFYFHLKGFDPTIANPAMPHMSPAKQLIKASGGLKEAKAKLTFLKEKAEKDWKGADWTISTALKHFGDLKEKEPNSDLYV